MTLLHAAGSITHYGTSGVGSGAILADDDDATYVDAPGGGNGFVVGLDALPSVPADTTPVTLHLRVSATGGWAEGAASEVWLCSDAAGDIPYVGFWDGASTVTVGFQAVGYPADGGVHDVSCLLTDDALTAWGATRAGVLAQLSVGSYLFFLDSYREATATAAPAKVYEAWIEVASASRPAPLRQWPGGATSIRQYPRRGTRRPGTY